MDVEEIINVPFEEDDLDSDNVTYRTYRMDFENKRIIGMVDEMDAAAQSIFKALQTRRSAYLIYDEQYGCDVFNKIGNLNLSQSYLENDIPVMIEDAFLNEEMITGISDILFEIMEGDGVKIEFAVSTIYGDTEFEGVITDG